MKKTEDLFSGFFAGSNTAMAIIDAEGFLLAYNNKLENLILDAAEEQRSMNRRLPIDSILGTKEAAHFRTALSRLLNNECGEILYEAELKTRNGNEAASSGHNIRAWLLPKNEEPRPKRRAHAGRVSKPLSTNERAVPREKGPYIGLMIEDTKPAAREEKKLLEDKRIAEKAAEVKTQFLANMSHEIRTPIHTIIGVIELLQDTALDREQSEYLTQAKFSAGVLLTLINDILDYSKLEAGNMILEHIDFDLEQTVEQAVETISLEAHKKSLYVAVDISPNAAITMKGDPGKFRQILINLVKNAVKFTGEGGITVTVRLTELGKKEALTVSVSDTGIGIAPEARKNLFSTFTQEDTSDTRRFGGTGLGLAVSRSLVELMKGRIEMSPRSGGGSVFSFTVPVERSGENAIARAPQKIRNSPVLVADNEKTSLGILCSYLRDLGCARVDSAASGEEALGLMRKAAETGEPYRICFVSMIMPVMDGWRFGAEIHNDPELSASSLVLTVPHGLLGADTKMTLLKWFRAYINKPIKRRNLAEILAALDPDGREADLISELEPAPDARNEDEAVREAPENKEHSRDNAPAEDKEKPLILVVEDHPINQKLLSLMLEKLSLRCICAENGREAVEMVKSNPVDLVFMDIQMPVMNGYEATAELRRMGFEKPIIAVTASAFSDEMEPCVKSGVSDILIKPFKRIDIEKMLGKWLNAGTKKEALPNKTSPQNESAETAPGGDSSLVFSQSDLIATFMGNDEIALSMLYRFVERTKSQLEEIPALTENEDWETARRYAHTIKGAAFTVGSKALGKAAGRLELALKNMDIPKIESEFSSVRKIFDLFKSEAQKFLSSMNFSP